jgi:hypothetical protein
MLKRIAVAAGIAAAIAVNIIRGRRKAQYC